jgi:hypothetical protein
VDPLTDEDMSNDTVCVLRFGVYLLEEGESAPSAGAEPGAEIAGAGTKY